jgi:O-antigen ligase
VELNTFRIAVILLLLLIGVLLVLRPKLITYIYLGLILYMPNTLGFGVKQGINYFAFYGAGTGVVVRPLISFYLLGLFVISLFLYRNREPSIKSCQPVKILLLLSAYYVLYALLGFVSGVPVSEIVGGTSTIHLFDMTLFMLVLLRFCSDEKELSRLSSFLIFCVFTREVYGFIRFLFFGGDISNVYANIERINVKLTFQDINDNLLGTLVSFYCAWTLFQNWSKITLRIKLFYSTTIVLSIFTIMFSFRRTAWIGLCIAGAWFVIKQPLRRRIIAAILLGAIGFFTFTTLLTMRLGQYEHKKASMLFYDLTNKQGDLTTRTGRLGELEAAMQTIKDNVIFGVGPWGTITHFSHRDYMHGGILQIWLKLGMVGLVLFLAAMVAYMWFCLRKSRKVQPENRGWFEAAFAGVLFMIPTFTFGTPIIEYRTMQLTALCLSLPYVVYAIYRSRPNERGQL